MAAQSSRHFWRNYEGVTDLSTEIDPRRRSVVPHEFEQVRAYERRNPFLVYEEKQAGIAVPESEAPELQREEQRVKSFESRAGEALLKRSEQDPSTSTVPMPVVAKPPSVLPWIAIGSIATAGGLFLLMKFKPSWFQSLAEKIGAWAGLEANALRGNRAQAMLAVERSSALASFGIVNFASGNQAAIVPESNPITFQNQKA